MNHVDIAEEYYNLLSQKKIDEMGQYLDENVRFLGPMDIIQGKKGVLKASGNFAKAFEALKIRNKFEGENQAVIIYDVFFKGMSEKIRGAVVLSLKKGLIVDLELFYDTSLVTQKKDEIFSQ